MKGLGPKSSAALRSIGIASLEELRARDPFDVYAVLKANVPGTSLNFLYGLIGAIEDVKKTFHHETAGHWKARHQVQYDIFNIAVHHVHRQ